MKRRQTTSESKPQFLQTIQSHQPSKVKGFSGEPVQNRPDADEDPDESGPDGLPISEDEKQRRKEKKQKDVAQRSKDNAEDETPVGSPGSDRSAIGPMGDTDNVVGKLARRRKLHARQTGMTGGIGRLAAGNAEQLRETQAPQA